VYKSINGFWRCEEFNPIDGQRVYMVEIDRSDLDSTRYWLGNFHNQDLNEGVIAQLDDTLLSISQQNLPTLIIRTGTGYVSSDFTQIEFNYQVFDGQNDYNAHAIYLRSD
jgi:hypothetical protein